MIRESIIYDDGITILCEVNVMLDSEEIQIDFPVATCWLEKRKDKSGEYEVVNTHYKIPNWFVRNTKINQLFC